ncbi:hypothetical protein NPS01_27630 [Nocardioides psychrotolerans]|uniref:Uncharacterized protein n=1 Tax=Nocardioides psychrotolerans TaxID=1005945 RepID=A0A1I3EXW2_9ACTN|nr:hypothetical protein NPS01_27630 [Nocardioides psychrotolerans]SFI03391.1 hypothetical protein SAMN05216561_104107 [Nocardioides psychrotolerans]
MSKKRQSAWRVAVRRSDGSTLYYAERTSRQGQSEWTPRVNQAHVFATENEAAAFAGSCSTNADAIEYLVQRV